VTAEALTALHRLEAPEKSQGEDQGCGNRYVAGLYCRGIDNLPGAAIVFDHFHLIKLFNDKLSKLRRELQRQAESTGKKVLKGTRWLLLKNPEHFSPEHNEKQRLEEALRLNSSLATAYYL